MNGEVIAALCAFVRGGAGPPHSSLTSSFLAAGLTDLTPYVPGSLQNLNKVEQVTEAGRAVWRQPSGGRRLVEKLLSVYRVNGIFSDPNLDMESPHSEARCGSGAGHWMKRDALNP